MTDSDAGGKSLDALIGDQVVLDVKANLVYIGTLDEAREDMLVLREADVHFCGDTETTQEFYVLQTKKDGIRVNRSVVYVMREQVVSLSRLSDVMDY
ncbi:MAG: hypothetical protein R6X33_00870 [Candidatus Brocadiia bacterium]